MAGQPVAGGTARGVKPGGKTSGIKLGRTRVSPKVAAAGVILIAAVWFILVNRASTAIYLWVPKVLAPLWVVLLITFLGGMLTALLLRTRKRRD